MSVETRLAALLRTIEDHRDTRCAEHHARAEADARALIAAAWRRARERTRGALEAERSRHAASVAREEAKLSIERRLTHQRGVRAALALAWTRLEAALEERWRDPTTRRRWIEHHLGTAAQLLGPGPWRIDHGPEWGEDERRWLLAWLASRSPREADFSASADIAAGFRVRAGHNVLDATLEGLLGDRVLIEGRLLDAIEAGTR